MSRACDGMCGRVGSRNCVGEWIGGDGNGWVVGYE